MKRFRVWAFGAAAAALMAALWTPERAPAYSPPATHTPFTWGQDALWARLERRFDAARMRDCEDLGPTIDAGLAGLDLSLERLAERPLRPDAPLLRMLESQLFEVAPLFGGCARRVPELMARTSRLRASLKRRSVSWDAQDRASRERLYRLLYGSRAAVEELLLQLPASSAPSVLTAPESSAPEAGDTDDSRVPTVEVHGVRLHSGDILISRGGAPTSALIARGNDFPGNFSHVALLHVSDDGAATVLESHIESGLGTSSADRYLADTKLRIMVLRLRGDHPAVVADPLLPHRAASHALATAQGGHVPYDFAMNFDDPTRQFCSEVAYAAYLNQGVRLWSGLSSMSGPGLTRWLSRFGVRRFATLSPSDLEYDPQVRVVAEYRDLDALYGDHIDNAVTDALLEGAENGDAVSYDYWRLPLARLLKAYSLGLNTLGRLGPIPEGMSATTGLRVAWLREQHGAVRAGVERRAEAYEAEHRRRPAQWTLATFAREALRRVRTGRAP